MRHHSPSSAPAQAASGAASSNKNQLYRYFVLAGVLAAFLVLFLQLNHAEPDTALAAANKNKKKNAFRANQKNNIDGGAADDDEHQQNQQCTISPLQKKFCPNCRSWPSFLSFRTRHHCKRILNGIADVAPYDLSAMHKRDKDNVLGAHQDEDIIRRNKLLKDRRPSAPFVTGDGFRATARFIFDETTVPSWDALGLKMNLYMRVPQEHGRWCERNIKDDVDLEAHITHIGAPQTANGQARENYWHHRTRQMVRLTEDAAIKNHQDIVPWLRFDCLQYGDVIFVQTHLLDKFITEVLPIFEKKRAKLLQCEEDKGPHCDEESKDGKYASHIPGFRLITHNSDYSSPWDSANTRGIKSDPAESKYESQIEKLLMSPMLVRWYGQNMVMDPARQRKILQRFHAANPTTQHPFDLLHEHDEKRAAIEKKRKAFDPKKHVLREDKPHPHLRRLKEEEEERKNRRGGGGRAGRRKSNDEQQREAEEDEQDEFKRKHDTRSIDVLRNHYEMPKRTLADHIEAKLIPIPIGLENRYNRYGRFVGSEYAAAAGCFHKDVQEFAPKNVVDDDQQQQQQQQQQKSDNNNNNNNNNNNEDFWSSERNKLTPMFQEDFSVPRERSRPFVSFSVKTNKREREDAIKAVEKNFFSSSSSSFSSQQQKINACVEKMLQQFNKAAQFSERQKHKPTSTKYQNLLRTYLAKLKCYDFTMAPRGHGQDTHRVWEALYSGSVPISATSPADLQLLSQLPILRVGGGGGGGSSSSSTFYQDGTYKKFVTPRGLDNFWCKSAKRVVESTLLEHQSEQHRGGGYQEHDGRVGMKRGKEMFFNSSSMIPVLVDENNNNDQPRLFDTMDRGFSFDLLDMSFWAHVVTSGVHPTREHRKLEDEY